MHRIVLVFITLVAAAAAGPTPSQYETLAAEARRAIESVDIEALKQLYFFEGAPEALVDQEISMWEYMIAEVKAGKAKYGGSEYMSREEFLKQVPEAPFAWAAGPVVMNGRTYVHTLDVVGMLVVRFNTAKSSGGGYRPVGLTPDGQLKFVVRKPKPANQSLEPTPHTGR